jgi:hypothetical protein
MTLIKEQLEIQRQANNERLDTIYEGLRVETRAMYFRWHQGKVFQKLKEWTDWYDQKIRLYNSKML